MLLLNSYTLNFAYAEHLEIKKDKEGVYAVFDKFLAALRKNLEHLEAQLNSTNSSFESNGSAENRNLLNAGGVDPSSQSTNASFESTSSDGKPPKAKNFSKLRKEYGLVWIMYLRTARRMDSNQAGRGVFTKVRKDRLAPWETYEANGAFRPTSTSNSIT